MLFILGGLGVETFKFIEYIDINNAKLCVSIRTQNESNPMLLYLHGGPGDAALPLVEKYNQNLESIFTVVILEQRGAGKSYYRFSEEQNICIATFLDDIYVLTKILLKRFGKEKLYLVGHSWGSVLGLKFVQRYPDMVHTYIGCGQVVNMMKSSRLAYEYALEKNQEIGNSKVVSKLMAIDCTYRTQTWLNDLLFVTGQVVKFKGSLYGKRNYNQFLFDFLFSSDYSLKDLINRQKGSLQSIKYLWQELMLVDFEAVKSFDAPVVFIEGRNDYHVSSTLANTYFHSITSEKEFYWFDNSCHFPQWSEAAKFYNIMKSLAERL